LVDAGCGAQVGVCIWGGVVPGLSSREQVGFGLVGGGPVGGVGEAGVEVFDGFGEGGAE